MHKKDIHRFEQRREYLLETLDQVDAIIAPSRFIAEMYKKGGVNPNKIIVTRQGRTIRGLDVRSFRKFSSPLLRLAYIGQITEIKGIHVLLEAIQLLPEAPLSLSIYGDLNKFPKYVKKLRRIVGDDERIQFKGLYAQDQITKVFKNIDIVVVPSLSYENSPNVILEAFAHRTPVIASNLGALPELVIDEKNGLLFEVGKAQNLANQINLILENPGLLRHLSKELDR